MRLLYLDRSVGYRGRVTRPVQRRRTAKDRILQAADDLFYNEGIHTVGIDRVIAHAGVAKGSLYYSFTGKDDLVHEYLSHRHGVWADRVVASAFAEQAVDRALATRADLEDIADAWRAWSASPDGWFAILHGELRATP